VLSDTTDKCWIGFPQDDHGIFLETRALKAAFKQSASLLRITVDKRGSKQILAEGTEIRALDGGDRIYLSDAPTGTEERAIHVHTPAGERSALRRCDYVTRPRIEFEVWVLRTAAGEARHISEGTVVQILTHMQENGIGASRSQGEGKFDVVSFESV
jgi:CRISPR/Cas system CSM-associated protein Csm4 (group 5 of RAMP superfamily)